MYDVNPLGLMMHLRDLDRQAAPKLRSLRLGEQHVSGLTAVGAVTISLLRRLDPTAVLQVVTRRERSRR